MPYFLDAFAPGVDPWRELLPEGLNPWWFGRARRFAELVEGAVPELSGSYQGRDWLHRWGSEEQRLWQVHRAIHPALPPADADDLWATDPAPVAERGKVLLAMEGALYELCMRYEVDPVVVDTALERSLRYRLYHHVDLSVDGGVRKMPNLCFAGQESGTWSGHNVRVTQAARS